MLGNHLIGLYEKALAPSDSWPQRLAKARSLGFDFMEISIDETDERIARLDWTGDEMNRLRSACYEAGLPIQSMCLSAHRRFPFGSADPAVRRRARELMSRAIDFCSFMGIRVIQLAGYDVYYEPSTPESVRMFREGLIWAARQAARKQVMLATEIMDTPFINSISKHMAYEAMIRSPWLRVYPDLGNLSAWPENDVGFELEHGIDSIVAVHLKDTLAVTDTFPGKFKCVPFGEGCVDFPRCFAKLEALGYMGPYMMEMWYDERRGDMEECARALDFIKKQFEKGRVLSV